MKNKKSINKVKILRNLVEQDNLNEKLKNLLEKLSENYLELVEIAKHEQDFVFDKTPKTKQRRKK